MWTVRVRRRRRTQKFKSQLTGRETRPNYLLSHRMGKSPKRSSGAPSSPSTSASSPVKTTSVPTPAFVVAKDEPVAITTNGSEEESDLLRLCDAITARAHLLAPGNEDLDLMRLAAEVVKSSFDRGVFIFFCSRVVEECTVEF